VATSSDNHTILPTHLLHHRRHAHGSEKRALRGSRFVAVLLRVEIIGRRKVDPVTAAAISEVVHMKDALSWFSGALGEPHAALAAQRVTPAGPSGGIFSNALFAQARGEATMFIPCGVEVRSIGRVVPTILHHSSRTG
jgi:hypothetical protein